MRGDPGRFATISSIAGSYADEFAGTGITNCAATLPLHVPMQGLQELDCRLRTNGFQILKNQRGQRRRGAPTSDRAGTRMNSGAEEHRPQGEQEQDADPSGTEDPGEPIAQDLPIWTAPPPTPMAHRAQRKIT